MGESLVDRIIFEKPLKWDHFEIYQLFDGKNNWKGEKKHAWGVIATSQKWRSDRSSINNVIITSNQIKWRASSNVITAFHNRIPAIPWSIVVIIVSVLHLLVENQNHTLIELYNCIRKADPHSGSNSFLSFTITSDLKLIYIYFMDKRRVLLSVTTTGFFLLWNVWMNHN